MYINNVLYLLKVDFSKFGEMLHDLPNVGESSGIFNGVEFC